MLNYEEARSVIESKMKRFISWSIFAVSEDNDNYYFFYGADGEDHPEPNMPVFSVNKNTGTVSKLSITKKENFKVLFKARVFYHRGKNIFYTVEERAAIRRKYEHYDEVVLCPRCGAVLQCIKQNKSVFIQCSTMYCIYCSLREW